MEPSEAFELGYLTSVVGVPLRGVALMNLVGKHATGELASAVDAQINGFRMHNAQTVENVLRVGSILAEHGLPEPARPRTADDWVTWAGHASKSAAASLKPESAAAAGLIAGGSFGDLLSALQLAQILVGLLADAPYEKELAVQITGHMRHADHAANQIELVLRHPALAASARPPLEAALAAYRGVSVIDAALAVGARHETVVRATAEIKRQGPELAGAFSRPDKEQLERAWRSVRDAVSKLNGGKPQDEACVFCQGSIVVAGYPHDGPYSSWDVHCPCGKSNTTLKGL